MLPMRRRNEQGFSVVELVIVIVIIGALAVIAYPAITALIPGVRLRAGGQEVYRALQTARTQAIKLNRPVRVDFESMACGNDPIPPVTGVGYEIHYRARDGVRRTLLRGELPPLVVVCETGTGAPGATPTKDVTTMPKKADKDAVQAIYKANGTPVTGGDIPVNGTIYLRNTKNRGLTIMLDQSGSVKVINKTET